MKAFSDVGTDPELPKLGRLLDTLGLANGEVMGATKRAELESVMADTGEKVGMKAGKVNVHPKRHRRDIDITRNSSRSGGARWSDANRSARDRGG